MQNIKKHLNENIEQKTFNSKTEQDYFNCLFYLIIILHELEHIKQEKEIKLISNSLENKLIHLSFGEVETSSDTTNSYKDHYSLNVFQELYRKYYYFCPIERLAIINSYKNARNILSTLNENFPIIDNHIHFHEIFNQINAYNPRYVNSSRFSHLHQQIIDQGLSSSNEILLCPTSLWLYGLNLQNEWSEFDFYNSNYQQKIKDCQERYSIDDRFMYGLPVSYEEYNDRLLSLVNKKN